MRYGRGGAVTDPSPDEEEMARRALARCDQLQHERSAVGQHLGFLLCADPVLDMILELYCAFARGYELSLSSLGAMANVPPTTAARNIRVMEGRGLIEQRDDRNDGRRTLVRLTGPAVLTLQAMFAAMDRPPRKRAGS
jgi:hypothetical protein